MERVVEQKVISGSVMKLNLSFILVKDEHMKKNEKEE